MNSLTRRSLVAGLAAAGLTVTMRSAHARAMNPDLSHLTPEQRARYEAMHARMMAALPYERVTVTGRTALAEWERLKSAGRGFPIVIGNDADLERIAEQFTIDDASVSGVAIPGSQLRSPTDILAAAAHIQFPADLRKWPGAYRPEDLRAPDGDWPSNVDGNAPGISVATDIISGQFHEKVHILLIPARFGWEIPAYLRWGGWNACPPPELHVAALRRWHELYGADLVGMNGDTMNIRVAHLPKAREEAIALAHDQYGYCPDIVDQGVGTISALAASLMGSAWWYFWWD